MSQKVSPSSEGVWQWCLVAKAGWGKPAPIQPQLRLHHVLFLKRLGSAGCQKIQGRARERLNSKPHKSAAWRLKIKNWGSYWSPRPLETITKAVASNLNMGKTNNTESSPSGFVGKPYLGRPHPSQLAPGVDGSLDPSLTCWYCKDTRHLKENCVKLTQQLVWNNQ